MNVCDTLSHDDTLMRQIWYDYVKRQKRYGPNTRPCQKPYKFDLQVKGQRRIRIRNGRDISAHGDRPMRQLLRDES